MNVSPLSMHVFKNIHQTEYYVIFLEYESLFTVM